MNKKTAILGNKANPDKDAIEVDGKLLPQLSQEYFYIAFNKPRRVLCDTKKTDDRKSISDYLEIDKYYFIVGRLDYDSEGLLLITNDGDLSNRLTHPRYEHEKEYQVELSRVPDLKQIEIWKRGVVLENGYKTLPASIDLVNTERTGTWLKVVMREGKKRQIREVGKRIGLPVKRIIRTRIGPINTGSLKSGEWRYLTKPEIEKLRN